MREQVKGMWMKILLGGRGILTGVQEIGVYGNQVMGWLQSVPVSTAAMPVAQNPGGGGRSVVVKGGELSDCNASTQGNFPRQYGTIVVCKSGVATGPGV